MADKSFNLAGRKLMIAIPCYDGKVNIRTAFALAELVPKLDKMGVTINLVHLSGCSIISKARNRLVRNFMMSDCTDFLFVDADVIINVEAVTRLLALSTDKDVVAGTYPRRADDAKFFLDFYLGEGNKLEFDENVIDAYAGQETLLRFRFTNQSDNELIKVHLHWDDPDTPDDLDFNLRSLNYIKPKQSTILAGNHIFTRFGFKEISDLQAIISDPEQKNAKFIVSPFNFKIANVGQTIINNITKNTTQNISIEGRGVVDASGSSANESQNLSNQTKSPVWKTLSVIYQSNEDNDFIESLINSLKAAEDASDSAEKKKTSLKTTLRDEVESLFYGLKDFNQLLPQRDIYRIVPASDISLHLLEVFHFKDLEAELDNLIGVAFENPQKVELDSDNFIDNFSGEATLITTTGLTILNNQDNLVNWTISYAWNQLKPNGLCFYRQRFGPGAYLISFGDESFKANVPGLKFDLRRYQGIESIELKYDKIDQTLSNILLLAPEASDISPRLNDESVHAQLPAIEEPSFAPTNLIQDAVSQLTSCI